MYPPAWIMSRTTRHEVELPGLTIPQGWLVVLSPYITHRNPEYWDQPESFDPRRFAGKSERPAHAYWPFGGGRRHCIGKRFAMSEMAVVLPEWLNTFDVSYVGDTAPNPHAMVTLRPTDGLPVVLRQRNK